MELWWIRHPGVLEAEKAALNLWGQQWEIDAAQFALGRLLVRVQVPIGTAVHEISAFYPDAYPYFPPQVRLEAVQLPRHHNPEGNLCLLADDAADWVPGADTLAGILQTQLPKLVGASAPGADPDAVAEVEEHAGEPLSNFLPYLPESVILVPDEVPPNDVEAGRLELHGRLHPEIGFVGVLSRVSTQPGTPLVEFSLRLSAADHKVHGNWVRLPTRPELIGRTAEEWRKQFLDLAVDKSKEFKKRLESAQTGESFVCGFLFPDEVRWRKSAQDWVLLWVKVTRERKGSRPAGTRCALVRADPAGNEAIAMRAPELAALRNKSVFVIGLGAIGSPVVLQLAKSGVSKLHIVDGDHIQVGNTIRWALGWDAAGRSKAEALAAYIATQYPMLAAV